MGMIVMGTAGASGFNELLNGSLTVRVLDQIRIPALIIPQDAHFTQLQSWVYASDLKGPEAHKVNSILNVAAIFNAQVKLLHVSSDSQKTINTDLQQIKATDHNFDYEVIDHRNVLQGLDAYIRQHQPDLLILVRHEHSFWEKLYKQNIVAVSAHHATLPLLVIYE